MRTPLLMAIAAGSLLLGSIGGAQADRDRHDRDNHRRQHVWIDPNVGRHDNHHRDSRVAEARARERREAERRAEERARRAHRHHSGPLGYIGAADRARR